MPAQIILFALAPFSATSSASSITAPGGLTSSLWVGRELDFLFQIVLLHISGICLFSALRFCYSVLSFAVHSWSLCSMTICAHDIERAPVAKHVCPKVKTIAYLCVWMLPGSFSRTPAFKRITTITVAIVEVIAQCHFRIRICQLQDVLSISRIKKSMI